MIFNIVFTYQIVSIFFHFVIFESTVKIGQERCKAVAAMMRSGSSGMVVAGTFSKQR